MKLTRVTAGATFLSSSSDFPNISYSKKVKPVTLPKGRGARLSFWIFLRIVHQHCDPAHPVGLLRTHRERPGGCRAAEQRDEIAASHVEHGLLPGTRCASLPQSQDGREAPAGPWGRPELF